MGPTNIVIATYSLSISKFSFKNISYLSIRQMVSDGQHFSQGVLPLPTGDEQAEGNFRVVEQLPVQGEHVEVDEGGEVVHPWVELIN